MQGTGATEASTHEDLRARIAELEAALTAARAREEAERARAEAERARANALEIDRDRFRQAHRLLQIDIELLRRRIFVAKAERVDTAQLELEFAEKKRELEALARKIEPVETPPLLPSLPAKKPRAKPKGRRDLSKVNLPEERVEVLDDELEGKVERVGFEDSYLLGRIKGGPVKIIIARAKYRMRSEDGTTALVLAPMPKRTFKRCLAAPSLLAKIAVDKFCDGLPLFRQERRFADEGVSVDRSTMSRWLEDLGATVGCVVLAMREEAIKTAFCIATDATGISVQPEPSKEKGRRPCRRGHFFVMLADKDHIFYEYTPRETSAVVAEMFRGFTGYVQADAKSVYDILFRPEKNAGSQPHDRPEEVGCWAHARRRFYEAAIAKNKVAREALFRIQRIFELERRWADVPPANRTKLRQQFAAPELDDLLKWAEREYEIVKSTRGLLRTALGYVVRQREALRRYLDDGRLRIDNNASERALRTIAVGRKAWLFVGSDDHADATANLFSLIASCRLHRLDPELYLRDLIRVLVHWPPTRYLELAPRYWAATRSRLAKKELEAPLGRLAVPPPEEQATPR